MVSVNAPILLLSIALAATIILSVHSADPDILTEFIVPNGAKPDADFFTHRQLRNNLWSSPKENAFIGTRVSQVELKALQGLGVSMALLNYGPGAINPPHTHPRASEILFVIKGSIEVGLVTSENKLFVQKLYEGDMFVFPKGMVHYQLNRDLNYPTTAVAAFGSASAGTVSLPSALLGSRISSDVLAKSFKAGVDTIDRLLWSSIQD